MKIKQSKLVGNRINKPKNRVFIYNKDGEKPDVLTYVRSDIVEELVSALEYTADLRESQGETATVARNAIAKYREE